MNIQHSTQGQSISTAGSDFLPNLAFNKNNKMIHPQLLKNLVICEKSYSQIPLVNFFHYLFSLGPSTTSHLNALGRKALLNSKTPTLTPEKPTYFTSGPITSEALTVIVEKTSFENKIKLARNANVDAKSLIKLKAEADLEKIACDSAGLENSLAKNAHIINAVKYFVESGEIKTRSNELHS
ncbi:MAG: hypothetical protein V4629_11815 [Pseudomonadota bacterium]